MPESQVATLVGLRLQPEGFDLQRKARGQKVTMALLRSEAHDKDCRSDGK